MPTQFLYPRPEYPRDPVLVAEGAQHKSADAVHAADGDEKKEDDEQHQKNGARVVPAAAPEQVGKQHRDQQLQPARGPHHMRGGMTEMMFECGLSFVDSIARFVGPGTGLRWGADIHRLFVKP